MKKIICILLAALLCMGTAAFAEESLAVPVKLIADSKLISTPTHIVNNRTLVPLRALMESTEAEVEWINDTRTAVIRRGDKTVSVQIGNTVMTTSEGEVTLDAAPVLLENETTTYVPLRAICEAFSFEVDWDSTGSQTILINSPDGCKYFDIYDGMTLEEYLLSIGASPEDFASVTGVDYESCKDKPYVEVDNSIKLGNVVAMNGYTLEDFCAVTGVENATADTPWGEFLDNLTMQQYIESFTPALQYGMTIEDAMASIKQAYGFGNEYTLQTPYKYLRPIMAASDYEYQKELEAQQIANQKAEEEKLAADKAALPGLLENKITFTITLSDNRQMKGELYPDLAPATVENFVKLCNEDFYKGLIFHRVIDGFMIQGGGYDKDFNEKEAEAITGEFYANGFTNALSHEKGVLSMARTNDPNSASSQFFIIDEAAPYLDGQYAAFGKITEGLSVVDAISQVKTETNDLGFGDVPVKPIIIKSIKIDK